MHRFVLALGTIRAPLLVTALAVLMLAFPPQTKEVFEAIQETESFTFWGEWARVTIAVLIFCFILLSTSFFHLRNPGQNRTDTTINFQPFLKALIWSLPVAIILALLLANLELSNLRALAKFISSEENSTEQQTTIAKFLPLIALAIYTLWLSILYICHKYLPPIRNIKQNHPANLWGVSPLTGLAVVILTILVINIAIACYPVKAASLFGPVGIFFLFFSLLNLATSLLCYIYDHHQIPILSPLIIGALLWVYFATNDNHAIRQTYKQSPPTLNATSAFKAWINERDDLEDYKNTPYPVFIITAEGGGLYAAAHSAFALSQIQEKCPAFAHHSFAISSVSAGSLGAAVFSALLKAMPPPKIQNLPNNKKCPLEAIPTNHLQDKVEEFFHHDFLTPLLSAGLFPDFSQRFLPLPIKGTDRALAFEKSLEQAWANIISKDHPDLKNLFEQGSRSIWSPEEDSPAILMNATTVQSGDRMVISPFRLITNHITFTGNQLDWLNNDYQVPLSTATSISARFPIILPPASHTHQGYRNKKRQFMDGGFYEKSGIISAINLIQTLSHQHQKPNDKTSFKNSPSCTSENIIILKLDKENRKQMVCFIIINIKALNKEPSYSHGGDYLAFIPTSYNVGLGHISSNLSMAINLYGKNRRKNIFSPYVSKLYAHHLNTDCLNLPLGWYLSKKTIKKIREYTKAPGSIPNCQITKQSHKNEKRNFIGNLRLYPLISNLINAR